MSETYRIAHPVPNVNEILSKNFCRGWRAYGCYCRGRGGEKILARKEGKEKIKISVRVYGGTGK